MLTPGLIVLHGNRLEDLLAAVAGWLREQPLQPLETETLLVQSQGMGEWVRMQLAESEGISAALRVELPARFLWRAYRAVLGPASVPPRSPLDKAPLTWRLMARLPQWLDDHPAAFAPLVRFLTEGSLSRRLQLAQRLADLLDQYQVHRGDWLEDWEAGREVLRRLPSEPAGPVPVPIADAWQPALWREVLASLAEAQRGLSRPAIHREFLQRLAACGVPGAPWPSQLPRRVVVFGTTHVPQQSLEAIAGLARGSQVLMAVPNPCRHYWADLLPDGELLRATRRRQAPRPGMPPSDLPLAELAPHGHPLLAAWGRQARDFLRLLDHYDDTAVTRARFGDRRIDFFDDGGVEAEAPWLTQVQARIRELKPLAEDPPGPPRLSDQSIVFHIAHHPQREVEVLHDQLLRLFATGTVHGPLAPREVVVMMPDVALFEPAIRAVFGQHERTGDPRHIPYRIADLRDRGRSPLLIALEWLLGARTERFTLSGLRALLDIVAVRARFGFVDEDIPILQRWLEQAGVRWGLHQQQRAALGLAMAGDQNSWWFGLRRLLLGYAIGDGEFAGIEACPEVGGLEAQRLGPLVELVTAIDRWWQVSREDRTPEAWRAELADLRAALFCSVSTADRALELALDEAMARWLEACNDAGFTEPVDLAVVREAWLAEVDDPGLPRRFRSGGVTFCTLLPLRAVPFRVVCLLGMNEADYPRRVMRADFDLMARSGLQRPGDRSARDDDRQLMLDALLSARDVLYVSWSGRSQRDDSEQPPSVLVAQLRDYLQQGWGESAVAARTTVHPLQPFSPRYFVDSGKTPDTPRLFTYAREWQAAHHGHRPERATPALPSPGEESVEPPDEEALFRFLRNPVSEYFRQRLKVRFMPLADALRDEEPFVVEGLEAWSLTEEVMQAVQRAVIAEAGVPDAAQIALRIRESLRSLTRAGRLPLGASGRAWAESRVEPLTAVMTRGLSLQATGERVELTASRLVDGNGELRVEKLARFWVRMLLERQVAGARPIHLLSPDVELFLPIPEGEEGHAEARCALEALLRDWRIGVLGSRPLPTALRTGLATLAGKDILPVYERGWGPVPGEGAEPCLARVFPDAAALLAAEPVLGLPEETRTTVHAYWSERLYAGLKRWVATLPEPKFHA